ncbi:MAG: hypothetical protein QF570_01915 [Myxococcota bacterium]|jgi:hypothetical protein|nr:hypothetical protein [Myxococcota bacterium]
MNDPDIIASKAELREVIAEPHASINVKIFDSIDHYARVFIEKAPLVMVATGSPEHGLIFVVPGVSETLRVNGRAELTRNGEILERLSARNKPALLATRVHVEESFFHCGKAFIRSKLWKQESGRRRREGSRCGARQELRRRIVLMPRRIE